jgi:hypothetical protein
MLSYKNINNKDMISYDDFVFDQITSTWVSASEYEEFLKAVNDDMEKQNIVDQETLEWDDHMSSVEQNSQRHENKKLGNSTII